MTRYKRFDGSVVDFFEHCGRLFAKKTGLTTLWLTKLLNLTCSLSGIIFFGISAHRSMLYADSSYFFELVLMILCFAHTYVRVLSIEYHEARYWQNPSRVRSRIRNSIILIAARLSTYISAASVLIFLAGVGWSDIHSYVSVEQSYFLITCLFVWSVSYLSVDFFLSCSPFYPDKKIRRNVGIR